MFSPSWCLALTNLLLAAIAYHPLLKVSPSSLLRKVRDHAPRRPRHHFRIVTISRMLRLHLPEIGMEKITFNNDYLPSLVALLEPRQSLPQLVF